jgi:hypothetical protein
MGACTSAIARAIAVPALPYRWRYRALCHRPKKAADAVLSKLTTLPELWNVRSSFEGVRPSFISCRTAPCDGLGVDIEMVSR